MQGGSGGKDIGRLKTWVDSWKEETDSHKQIHVKENFKAIQAYILGHCFKIGQKGAGEMAP